MLDVAHPAFDLVGMSQDLFLIGEILLLLNGGRGGGGGALIWSNCTETNLFSTTHEDEVFR